jgi:hypothetical protein
MGITPEMTRTVVTEGHTKIIDFNSQVAAGLDTAGRQEKLDAIRELSEKLPHVELDLSDPNNPKVLLHGQIDVVTPQK